jgi:hypothetical protein
VFIIFRNDCEFYKNANCLKKNAFCDLQCGKTGFEDGFVPLREFLHAGEKSEDNSDLENLSPLRLPNTIVKKERETKL